MCVQPLLHVSQYVLFYLCVCVSALVFIPLVPITRVADKNTNTDKRGPLSLQSEHVIKFAAPVVTAGKKAGKKNSSPCAQVLCWIYVRCHVISHRAYLEKKNSMFLIMLLQPGS